MAGLIQFTNNAATLLASSITSGDTSLTVSAATGSLFPTLAGGQYFYCTLTNAAATVIEIVKVTARSTDTFTIVRAQDGTSASAFSAGEKVELRLVAVELQNFPQLDSTNTFAAAQTFTSPIAVTSGGTGLGTLTANNVILGAGTSTPTFVAPSTSGNLLTSNGTTWVSSTPATPNVAGGASTVSQGTSLTLTSASNRVQNVTLTASGLSVTLPDATTLSAGGPVYFITNTGALPFTIKQNGGAIITTLTSGQSVEFKLISSATAAGTWNTSNVDISQLLPVTQYAATQVDTNAIAYYWLALNYTGKSMNGINNTNIDILKVSSTTALMTWVRSSNNSVYGAVVTNTGGTITVGTIVQIYDGSVAAVAATNFNTQLLTGLTTGMCFVSRTNATFNAVAIPFSISGTTITVGTSSAPFGFSSASYQTGGRVVQGATAMSSTVMLISYMSVALTTFVVNTITYNGASAPTLGTSTATITFFGDANYGGYGPANLAYLTATTAQLWYFTTANNLVTRIITTNGILAPTLGTVLNTTTNTRDDGQNTYQIFVNSATETAIRFVAPYNSKISTMLSFAISGTTVTLQNTNSSSLLTSSVPVPISSGAGLYISNNSTSDTQTTLVNQSNTGVYKYNFVTGDNVYSYSSPTGAFNVYAGLQSVAVLSATTGIVVGYSPTFMPYANAININ